MNHPTVYDGLLLGQLEADAAGEQGNDERVLGDTLLGGALGDLLGESPWHPYEFLGGVSDSTQNSRFRASIGAINNRPREIAVSGGMAKGWWS
jgi:hypothetical protein